jgi:molybdate transport repressor ModE-like protein
MRVEIEPVWRFRREDDQQSMLVMLDLLVELRASGKITRAAEQSHLSYRHCWNLLEKWADFFGAPLVQRLRGRGTQLTALGEKLVWAGQRLQARLRPQLQNLAQELETDLNEVLPARTSIVRMHASHGFAVSKLSELISRQTDVRIDLRYLTNQNSLVSLAHGACDLAGVHLPRGPLRAAAIDATRPWLNSTEHRIIGLVTREMGLIVKRGNPLRVTSVDRLLAPQVRFVNRDPESGTRRLLDLLLQESALDTTRIDGYERVEFTHAAVAAYVASGMADVSFGVEAAARQFDLDFVRLVTEDYFFVCRRETLDNPAVVRVLEVMRSSEFQEGVAKLPGYAVKDAGKVKSVKEALRS